MKATARYTSTRDTKRSRKYQPITDSIVARTRRILADIDAGTIPLPVGFNAQAADGPVRWF